jgi:hypothetical protein
LKPNGTVGSKFEVFTNVDALRNENDAKVNYGSKQMKGLIYKSPSKKLLSTLSPPRSASKSPERNKKRDIEVAKPEVVMSKHVTKVEVKKVSGEK